MKKIWILLMLQLAAFVLFAQKTSNLSKATEPFDPIKDQKTINGYTVCLLPVGSGGFGFDILQNNRPVVHQFQNPLPYAPNGVQKKEDAYKIAQWMITQYNAKHHWAPMMPPQVARSLNIQIN